MNATFRQQLGQKIVSHQNAATGALLFVTAFSVFTLNAMFNQSGNHPLPLWSGEKSLITNSVSVPVRRVETTSFKADKVPVPQLRPLPVTERQTTPQPLPIQISSQNSLAELKNVQNLLNQMGFYSGSLDGIIGSGTKSAIRAFEQSKFLPQNGEVTDALILLLESSTNARLQEKSGRQALSEVANSPVTGPGEIITRVQVGLINYGIPGVSIDGVMGNNTRDAIKLFQKQFKLEITGEPTRALVKKLESVGALTRG